MIDVLFKGTRNNNIYELLMVVYLQMMIFDYLHLTMILLFGIKGFDILPTMPIPITFPLLLSPNITVPPFLI